MTWIIAKNSKNKRVLLGGLGSIGVGQMWFEEHPDFAKHAGYAEAPERDSSRDWARYDSYAKRFRALLEREGDVEG